MPRATLRVVLLCAAFACSARGDDDADQRAKLKLLTVNKAIDEAREHLKRGNYRDAVARLEKDISLIDGNRAYLLLLRDSYVGHVGQLRSAGKADEAARYQDRLRILQPDDAPRELPSSGLPATTPERSGAVTATLAAPRVITLGKSKGDDRPAGDDPFGEANRAMTPTGVVGLVEQAERAFGKKNWADAARLYEEAEAAAAGSVTGPAKGHWAYCKLVHVADAINDGIPAGDELEREVSEAVRLAPTALVTEYAGQLREKMKDAVAGVAVKHTPREGGGWALAETANFRVFHATTEAQAEKAARLAEATRAAMARKWLGSALPTWTPRCDVYLHPTVKGYAVAGGREGVPGHSSISLPEGRVTSRRIDLRMDDPHVFASTLPHEATHVVLAGQFGKHHLPRWADEGVAVLSEGRERVGLHLRNLPAFRREGKLFRVETMFALTDYPEAERITPFYAQSVSMVEFLATRKGPAALAAFIREGLDGGDYAAAAKRHYGYESLAALEEAWLGHAFGDSVAKASVGK